MKPSYRRSNLNLQCAFQARCALAAYAGATGRNLDENDTVVGDFIADLMHYCQQNKIDFKGRLQNGRMHFEAEASGRE